MLFFMLSILGFIPFFTVVPGAMTFGDYVEKQL
jgi:hypothetical protein